jgi:hypothetical protein
LPRIFLTDEPNSERAASQGDPFETSFPECVNNMKYSKPNRAGQARPIKIEDIDDDDFDLDSPDAKAWHQGGNKYVDPAIAEIEIVS